MYWTLAFILQKSDAYENDRILDVFTQDFGRVEVIARGTRKLSSKLNGHLNLLDEIEIGLVRGSSRWVLVDAQVITPFVKNNPKSYQAGFEILSLTSKVLWPDNPEKKIFNAMREALLLLQNFDDDPSHASLRFWAQTLVCLGYSPILDKCAECKKPTQIPAGFSLLHNGIMCALCAQKEFGNSLVYGEQNFWDGMRRYFSNEDFSFSKEMSKTVSQAELFLHRYSRAVAPQL